MVRTNMVLRALLAALLAVPLASGTAGAQEAYRYWSYWWGQEGGWNFAQTGPADRKLSDGDVEGWRYIASADAVPTDQPRQQPDFDAICAGTPAEVGQIRVAVVIDFGADGLVSGESAPQVGAKAVCAVVPEGSTGEKVLNEVAEVRTEGGAVCGIDGYPRTGCFEVAELPVADGTATAEDGPQWLWLGSGAIALLAVIAAVLIARSRRSNSA